MAEATDVHAAPEPSMEEILASIRRIIADEKEPVAAPESAGDGDEDVLELTQMVQDDGSVVDIAPPPPPAPEPVPEPIAAPVVEAAVEVEAPAPVVETPPPPPPAPVARVARDDGLISSMAATAASSSLAALANTVQIERRAAMPIMTPIGNGARTLEEMVLELMRPMLKDWLDQNLPAVVERIVQKEVERIARHSEE